jgi:hypothetical protein
MTKHRGMTFRKFVIAVGEELIKRYFEKVNKPLQAQMLFNDNTLDQFLNTVSEEERLTILEDFEVVNDIADKGMGCIERAKRKDNISTPSESRERTAMRLFLDYPNTFQLAHDYYLCFTREIDVVYCQFPPESKADFSNPQIDVLQNEIAAYYQLQNKGSHCSVRPHFEDNKHYILIERGDYIKSDMEWKDNETKSNPIFYRPGKEDVIVYNPANKVLGIKLSGKDVEAKQNYIELFGKHILGQSQLPDSVYTILLISLEPFRTGDFDYSGNTIVKEIKLIKLEGTIL